MTVAEAHNEALRRIQSAKATGQHWLDLGDIEGLESIPEEIAELTELRVLGLGADAYDPETGEWQWDAKRDFESRFSDLSSLAGLPSLQLLNVSGTKVNDLSPLAGLPSLQSLNLYKTQVSDLSPLAGLPSLQSLNVSGTKVSDLSHLAGLPSLQSLNVSYTKVSDLSPLAGLPSLKSLTVTGCQSVASWEPLRGHVKLSKLNSYDCGPCLLTQGVIESIPTLAQLVTNRILHVPPEVLSEDELSYCLGDFKSWAADLATGEAMDQEVKLFVLGNGTAGKTQICRQLRDLGFDPAIPSTHGVQIGFFDILADKGDGATRAKLWDFGGQDIYHGTHALFLEGRAVFILVWSLEVEGKGDYQADGLAMHHHGLVYWLDYVRSLAGDNAAVIVVQAKCDRESDRVAVPLPVNPGFKRPLPQITCSAKEGEMGELKEAIRSATRYLLEQHGTYRLPKSWVAVRDTLRKLKSTEKTLTRERFDDLCRETHGISVPAALLSYLHRAGELFYRPGLFHDDIVLDQEWAVRAIYAVLDRKGPCQVLRQVGGVFTLPLLASLAWKDDEFSAEEQDTLLSMMESCAICFRLDQNHPNKVSRYAVPDMLPKESDVAERVAALWRSDLPAASVTLEYTFLHEGILRQFLCQIGQIGGADAAYWRYGCCFYDRSTHSRARIRAQHLGTPEAPAKGCILIETCEGNARELLVRLQKAVMEIRIGEPPKVLEVNGGPKPAPEQREETMPLADTLKIAPAPTTKPLIYFSYAWGGEKEKLVDRLEARLINEGYDVKRDKRTMRPGDWISDFMRDIGRAERVCVVLSEKYVQSPYCMRELLYLYQSSLGEKQDFLKRIVPLVLEDVKIGKTKDRLTHVRYWTDELKSLRAATEGLDPASLGTAVTEMAMINEFCFHTEPMLHHVSDCLMPQGIADIEKDNFAAVLQVLGTKV